MLRFLNLVSAVGLPIVAVWKPIESTAGRVWVSVLFLVNLGALLLADKREADNESEMPNMQA